MQRTQMITISGTIVDLLDPKPGAVSLHDVTWHLSLVNRFTGAIRRPYSVAEHSLLVAEIVERMVTSDVHAVLAALMHDGHEAYTNDVSSPGKVAIGPAWHAFERRHAIAVRSAFAILSASARYATIIKAADNMALATELQQICAPGALEASGVTAKPIEWIDLMDPGRVSFSHVDWADAMKDRVQALDFGRQAHR